MTQATKLLIAFWVGIIVFVSIGTITGIFKEDIKEKILISDELQKCENQGGEFRMFKNSFSEKYNVNCEIPEKILFEYEI